MMTLLLNVDDASTPAGLVLTGPLWVVLPPRCEYPCDSSTLQYDDEKIFAVSHHLDIVQLLSFPSTHNSFVIQTSIAN
jgi:hypothetical protein